MSVAIYAGEMLRMVACSVCFVLVIKVRQATATLRSIDVPDNQPIMKNIREISRKARLNPSIHRLFATTRFLSSHKELRT